MYYLDSVPLKDIRPHQDPSFQMWSSSVWTLAKTELEMGVKAFTQQANINKLHLRHWPQIKTKCSETEGKVVGVRRREYESVGRLRFRNALLSAEMTFEQGKEM